LPRGGDPGELEAYRGIQAARREDPPRRETESAWPETGYKKANWALFMRMERPGSFSGCPVLFSNDRDSRLGLPEAIKELSTRLGWPLWFPLDKPT